jgi:hypothetical protein
MTRYTTNCLARLRVDSRADGQECESSYLTVRAERIDGKLDVWTGVGAGTEIQLKGPRQYRIRQAGRGLLVPPIPAKREERRRKANDPQPAVKRLTMRSG